MAFFLPVEDALTVRPNCARIVSDRDYDTKKGLATFVASPYQERVGMTGFEPATSTSRTEWHRVASDAVKELATTPDFGCTSGCTNSPKTERGESVSSKPESLPIKGDSFSAALGMIASLPLSDAEKADAVRRLMAELSLAKEPRRG